MPASLASPDARVTVVSVVPEEVMQSPSGFGSARRKVSCYSVGVAGFRVPGLYPVPNPQRRGSRGACLCAYAAYWFTLFCALPSRPTKGSAKYLIPGPWLLLSPDSSLQVVLTINTCFLSLGHYGIQLFY